MRITKLSGRIVIATDAAALAIGEESIPCPTWSALNYPMLELINEQLLLNGEPWNGRTIPGMGRADRDRRNLREL